MTARTLPAASRGCKGALYGTTTQGGNVSTPYGTAFKLSRSRSGNYTETILHDFFGTSDGIFPSAPLLLTADGVLYGTAEGGGSGGGGIVLA